MSANLRGVLWMVATSAFYSLLYIAARDLTAEYSTAQVVLFRSVMGGSIMFC